MNKTKTAIALFENENELPAIVLVDSDILTNLSVSPDMISISVLTLNLLLIGWLVCYEEPHEMKKNMLMLIRPVLSTLSYYLKALDINFKTIFPIIAKVFCLFLCELSLNVGLCMPGGSDIVNLGLIDFYRPVVNQLPAESGWVYMFDHFEELKSVIQTSSRGHLLGPEETYEFIQQLYPVQLQSLLDSLLVSFRDNRPGIAEQCIFFSRDLLQESTNCLVTLNDVAHQISLVRGIDISNQPLEESFPALVRELNFYREVERRDSDFTKNRKVVCTIREIVYFIILCLVGKTGRIDENEA